MGERERARGEVLVGPRDAWMGGQLLLGCIVLASCGTPTPRTTAGQGREAAPTVAAASAAPTQAPQAPALAELPAGQLRKAWTSKTRVWNRAVVVAPFGDIVSLGARQIHVHARDTGRVLESGATCYTRSRHALAFQSGERAVLACAHRLVEITFPGLASTTLVEIDGAVTATAASGQLVAFAHRGGDVRVLDASSGKDVERVAVGGDVEEIAWAADSSMLALGLEDGRVVLRDRRAGVQREVLRGKRRVGGVAFSRDATELFVHDAPFTAHVIDLHAGRVARSHKVGPWVSTAAPIGPGLFAATGSSGLVLYRADLEEGRTIAWDDSGNAPSCEGLDVSEDGSLLCAGDRAGDVSCFTTRPLSSSTYRATGAVPPGQ